MMQADVKLDTLGYFCPMPIIMTSKKIKELTLGQVLEVVTVLDLGVDVDVAEILHRNRLDAGCLQLLGDVES